jgi:amino acid permease
MTRKSFLTLASFIAIIVGFFALFFPVLLQESKGTSPNSATYVWTSEVGILLIAIGLMAFMIRKEDNSTPIRAFFFVNFIIQIGLFLIELFAYLNDVIIKISGIIPNLTIHLLLAIGFLFFWINMNREFGNRAIKGK